MTEPTPTTKRSFRLANNTIIELEWTDTRLTMKSSRVGLVAPEQYSTVAELTLLDARELALYLTSFILNTELSLLMPDDPP